MFADFVSTWGLRKPQAADRRSSGTGLWPAPKRPLTPVQRIPVSGGWYHRQASIMGTSIGVDLWADDADVGEAAVDAVMAEMHRIDRRMSPHKPDSELSRINSFAGHQAVPVSSELFALLARAVGFSRLSGGAFDITFASVGNLFDYRHGQRPTDAQIDEARRAIGWQYLDLDARERTVRFRKPGMRIDLGGFAKGHAVDNATSILRGMGIHHAIVSAGGDSRVIGDRRGQPWTVAIRHPRQPDEVAAVMPLIDCAISTSGDYERGFDENGTRWHHIVDPSTGRSPNALHSVTILANDGLTAEALSKTVFVLGLERGLAIVEAMPGTDAVVIDAHGVLHVTSGLQGGAEMAAGTRQ
jgi:FAD:protein FMN transferase